jgi:type II secretory pathway pseudopilin PulG
MSRPLPSAGFTLIELAILLVLFGLLAGMAVPSLSRTMSRARVDAALSRLSADLFLARALAVREARPLRIRFLPPTGCAVRYEIVTDSGAVLRSVTSDPERTGVCLGSNVARPMRVNARGMLIGSPRTLRASRGDIADSAVVSIVGRVYRAP